LHKYFIGVLKKRKDMAPVFVITIRITLGHLKGLQFLPTNMQDFYIAIGGRMFHDAK